MKNFLRFKHFLRSKYLYVDTKDYLADSIFCKNKIPVHFSHGEYTKEGEEYILVVCSIRNKYKDGFENSLEELKNKMHLMGHTDYEEWCDMFMGQLNEA